MFGSRPVATSSSSTSTSRSWQWMTIPVERRSTRLGDLARVEVDALREQLREALGDLDVLHAQHLLRTGEDRHLRSVGLEHVPHLGGDEASADDAQPLGKPLQPHDRVGRVEPGLDQSRDRRDRRACSGGDQDVVGGDRAVLDIEHLGCDEPGGGLDQRDVGRAVGAVLTPVDRDRIDAAEHPVADRHPVGAADRHVEPEPGAVASLVGEVGRQDEHLRRHAAAVDARPAEHVALDDRDLPAVEVVGDRVPGSRSDDDQVVPLAADPSRHQ